MTHRSPSIHTSLQYFNVGPFKVKQPLPADDLKQLSPFVLLHHGGPTHHSAGEIKSRLGAHPHRGFEPVTFLFSGKIHHRDSTGSEGFLESGDVQWMTAGRGIIHSEGPSDIFAKEGGEMELVQLWVNLPGEFKMSAPKYQDIKKKNIPIIQENGFDLKLVAGEYKGILGPASTFSPIMAMMVDFKKDAAVEIAVPDSYNAMVYVLNGSVTSNGKTIQENNLAVFEKDGEAIELSAITSGKLLLLAGEPINEPMVSYGPFVMNYPAEIRQAILDFETGQMGVLEG
ncbi:MAG: pirin family protein [Flavisolibacter sp.]